jgi:Fe-S-cluster containining protein
VELPVIDNCGQCGACCMSVGVPPFTNEEYDNLDGEVQTEIALYKILGRTKGMVCAWLTDTRECDAYAIRPIACRQFERGGVSCRVLREEYGVDRYEG